MSNGFWAFEAYVSREEPSLADSWQRPLQLEHDKFQEQTLEAKLTWRRTLDFLSDQDHESAVCFKFYHYAQDHYRFLDAQIA